MRTSKRFVIPAFLLIFLTIGFLNISSPQAGTFTATLGSDGVIMLDADFNDELDCIPDGLTPSIQIAEMLGCYSLYAPAWSIHGERALTCATRGRTLSWGASASGGRMNIETSICEPRSASLLTVVTITDSQEVNIVSPADRVTPGIHDVVVEYDFKYDNADTCSGHIPYRNVSGFSNLPVSGTVSYPYDFSNQTGVVKIEADACCDGNCKPTDKLVYVEPEDLGNPGGCRDNILVGKPVNAASGNVFTSQTDFTLQGIMPINFTRYYNSKGAQIPGEFFSKWSHTFETRAFGWGSTIIKVINADGSIFYYQDNDDDKVYDPVLPKGIKSRVIMNPDSSMVREFDDGAREEFNKYSYLTAIVDRNGNRTTLQYDTYGTKLMKITDPAGRVINIAYDIYNRINKITLPDGKIINYTYASSMLQEVTYPDGSYRTYEYDGYNLTGIKDENGNYIEKHIYDLQGRAITSSADGTNELLTLSYVDDVHTTVTSSGSVTTYTIDKTLGRSHVTSISGPGCKECGQGNVSYTYDNNLNVTSETDANGNTTTYTYDADGNMLTKTEAYATALQRTTTYTYNAFGQTLTITDPDGYVTTYAYDATGNLLQEIDSLGNVTTHTYDSKGQKLTDTDPKGNITTYTYDQYGNLASITNALNQTTTYTYDIMANLLSLTDANGSKTTYAYDSRYRLIKETRPNGGIITYTYDLAGNRTAMTDANGNRTTFTYDSLNRLTELSTQNAERTTYTYDSEGNMTSMEIKDSANNITMSEAYTYDIYNRLIKTTHADSTFTEQTYDNMGNIKTKKDENSNVTTFFYDVLNRLTSVSDPNAGVTSYTYDKRNNFKTVTDANANITTYNYNSLNRLISTASPDTGTTTYSYDANRNMTSKTDANSITTTYVYDALNRQTSIQFPDSTQNINYYYDDPLYPNSKGRLSSMTDMSGITWYDYDKMGWVIKETKQINNITYITQYSYDLNGNLLIMTYPGGRKIKYSYNNNRVTKILNYTATIASNISYKSFGGITSLTYGNNLQQAISYDQRYQITSITTGSIQNLSYFHDANGNITGITNNLDTSKNKTYTYDALNRLKTAIGPWGNLTYNYDSVGNRQTEATGTGSTNYFYNANKLVKSTGQKGFNFSYDNNGNSVSENTKQYIYNQNQRLIKVINSGTTKGQYTYNANGQRVKKITSSTIIYHYDLEGKLMAESTAAGKISAVYVYLNGNPFARIQGSAVYYYHNDNLGTSYKMTNNSGTVVWYGEFKPFGEQVSITGSIINNLRFPGQYYDAETGLHYNYFRDYKPQIGRYVEADPIGIEGGKNLYLYSGDNPISNYDPDGLLVKCKIVSIGKTRKRVSYYTNNKNTPSSGYPVSQGCIAVDISVYKLQWKNWTDDRIKRRGGCIWNEFDIEGYGRGYARDTGDENIKGPDRLDAWFATDQEGRDFQKKVKDYPNVTIYECEDDECKCKTK